MNAKTRRKHTRRCKTSGFIALLLIILSFMKISVHEAQIQDFTAAKTEIKAK